MKNQTYFSEFYLVPFFIKTVYTSLTTSVYFLLYISGILINPIIITVIYIDAQLHTPMYLFLCNLSLVDICYTTTTVPNLLYMLLSGDNIVSFIQCFSQMFFYMLAASTENLIILIMAYDRYVAICVPLHYHYILNRKICFLLASGTWISGCLNSFVFTFRMSQISFCHSSTMQQFLCDPKAVINIACMRTEDFTIALYVESMLFGVFPVMFNLTSYIKIIRVILQINSKDGRKKAFSTCSSHLIVIIICYLTSFSVYLMPPSEYSNVLETVLTAVYSVVTPMINPPIYSLKNKDVKKALVRIMG